MQSRIVIFGGSGLIGRALCRELLSAGYDVLVLTRNASDALAQLPKRCRTAEWNGRNLGEWAQCLDGAFGVVNLAGLSVARRWSKEYKARLVSSRIDSTKAIISAIAAVTCKPEVLIQGSAMGYYGSSPDRIFREDDPPGRGFLAELARQWEESSLPAERVGVRRVIIRTSTVLDREGGALPELLKPFRFHVGGTLGNGRQWFAWIHNADEAGAIRFLLETPDASGPFNLCTPEAVTLSQFCQTAGKVLGRKCWTRVPGWALRLVFGEMAKEVLLASQKLSAKRLVAIGYEFKYPELEGAFREIVI